MIRGFTLIELLIAMAITLLIAGAVAAAAPAARAVFDRVPVELEMQQRGRTAIDTLTSAVRAADYVWPVSTDESGNFTEVTLIVPVLNAAQGILAVDQTAPGGSISLEAAPCPNVKDVCGFTSGMTALISDADGGVDVFVVTAANVMTRSLTPGSPLSRAYGAGAAVREIEEITYRLDDASSLVRETAAGAVQPIADSIADLSFSMDGDLVNVMLAVQPQAERLRGPIADRHFSNAVAVRNLR